MIRTRRIAGAVALACASVAFAPRTAHADDDPRKKAAEAVFQEGVKLHAQGKNEEALAKLQKAYDTYPSPNTLGGIARVEQAMGRSLDAIRHYREAVRNPLMHPENAEYARRAIAELEKQLARIDAKGPKGLVVTIDKRDYVLPLAEPVDVKADTYELSGKLGETRYEGRATAPIGKVTEIELKPIGGATAAPPPPQGDAHPVEPPPVEPSRPFWDTGRIVGAAAFGVGVVGVGAGLLFGKSSSDAASHGDELQSRLGRDACGRASPPAECADLKNARDDQDRDAALSRVFVIGGAVVAAGGVALFVWPRSDVRVTPSAGKNGASILLTGTF
jgi:tetratricopeptide (TPR) repeat protein